MQTRRSVICKSTMININDYIKILPCFKFDTRGDVIRISILSRLFMILLQFLSNSLIKDHDAKVFVSPKSNETVTLIDVFVQYFLNGFLRWDAQYYLHIVKYGYTYENVLAFFPLYPVTIQLLVNLFTPFMPLFNEESIISIIFIEFNVFIFTCAAVVLYDLTTEILGKNLAYKATILYCFNPASIFFSAPYAECLFSYLTFKCMWHLHKKNLNYKSIIMSVFYISLSMCTRSNGVLNVGFLIYYYIKYAFKGKRLLHLLKHGLLLLYFVSLCFVPFVLIQSYNYFMFCKDFQIDLPDVVLKQAKENDFVLPGNYSRYRQSWCSDSVPFSYSYVQNHYWNVGFLKYYKLKQIPNFLLALPVICLIITNCKKYFVEHKMYSLNLGIFNLFKVDNKRFTKFRKEIFVYVVHLFCLTIFCTLCIHVQVTTRMICSSSPLLYWFCAYYYENYSTKQKIFFLDSSTSNMQIFVKCYFIGYFIIGAFMFCNFLPWT